MKIQKAEIQKQTKELQLMLPIMQRPLVFYKIIYFGNIGHEMHDIDFCVAQHNVVFTKC